MICYRTHPDVVYASLHDNTGVLLHLGKKLYYTLNETGRFLWEQLGEPCTLEELVKSLLQEYEVSEAEAKEAVTEFLNALQQEGLIVTS